MSAAAMDGITDNGLRWKHAIRLGVLPARLGKLNDAAEAPDSEVESIAQAIVAKVRAFAANLSEPMKGDLERRVDDLEMAQDCGLEEVTDAMSELYDSFDYWRIRVESHRL